MAKKSKLQTWIEYGFAKSIFVTLGALPRSAAVGVGILVARLMFPFLGKLRRVGMRNLELAYPEKSAEERGWILGNAFWEIGRWYGMVGGFGKVKGENIGDLVVYEPDDDFAAEFAKARDAKRGLIVVTAHLGNWEMFALAYSMLIGPANLLSRRMDNPLIDKMVTKMRTGFGNNQIDKENSAAPILRILRGGGTVGILADVNAHPKEGVFVPFFGIPACTTAGVGMLAIRANALIVPMFALWNAERGHYTIAHDRMIEPSNTGDRKKDIEETTAQFTAAIERVIRSFPDHWIWIHRRWKTRPPGEPELYDNI